jgi:hypothetical protein
MKSEFNFASTPELISDRAETLAFATLVLNHSNHFLVYRLGVRNLRIF